MASIVHRNNRYYVVYLFTAKNGVRKQKWETYHTKSEATNRKREIEYKESKGTFIPPQCKTLAELIQEYVSLYGKTTWALSTYTANTGLIRNYILPIIGNMNLSKITTLTIEQYYQRLLKVRAVAPLTGKPQHTYVSADTVHHIHRLLRNCFEQAVKWELVEKNPCLRATVPKHEAKEREIWTPEIISQAIGLCKDPRLKLAIHLSFSCSLRIGELLGLTWDCVDLSPEKIETCEASITVNKELQRVNRNVLRELGNKDVLRIFPSSSSRTTTVQLLKTPKTKSSIRKIFLPASVSHLLLDWKKEQDQAKRALGKEYTDFNLVLAGPFGMPTEPSKIHNMLRKLIEENDLPPVVFHSLRHSSITYKLKLTGGDIKAVQGDSGHAQANMVTDVYSHILDENRKENARSFERSFYAGNPEPLDPPDEPEALSSDLSSLIANMTSAEASALLKALAGKL